MIVTAKATAGQASEMVILTCLLFVSVLRHLEYKGSELDR
jgi:hypothetical protein